MTGLHGPETIARLVTLGMSAWQLLSADPGASEGQVTTGAAHAVGTAMMTANVCMACREAGSGGVMGLVTWTRTSYDPFAVPAGIVTVIELDRAGPEARAFVAEAEGVVRTVALPVVLPERLVL